MDQFVLVAAGMPETRTWAGPCSVSYEQTLNSSDRTDSHLSLVPFRYHNPGSAHNTSIAANATAQECQPESGSLLRSRSNNSSPPAFWE